MPGPGPLFGQICSEKSCFVAKIAAILIEHTHSAITFATAAERCFSWLLVLGVHSFGEGGWWKFDLCVRHIHFVRFPQSCVCSAIRTQRGERCFEIFAWTVLTMPFKKTAVFWKQMATKAGSVVEKEGSGSLNVMLHPLVIINISDHWTRNRVQNNVENPRVVGALLGQQTGTFVERFLSADASACVAHRCASF